CRVLVEVDRGRGAHIEPEPLDQSRTGGITLLATGVHLHLGVATADRPELAPVARLPRVPLAHDPRLDRLPPAVGCSQGEAGDANGGWDAPRRPSHLKRAVRCRTRV